MKIKENVWNRKKTIKNRNTKENQTEIYEHLRKSMESKEFEEDLPGST